MENLKNLLVGCILILSIHLSASAQGIRRISEVLVSGGFPNATVRVCTEPAVGVPCTPLATIYSDPGLTQVASNPLTTDASGNYAYFANPYATYHEQISGNGLQEYDIPYIMLPISGAAMLAANNTWTGSNTFLGGLSANSTNGMLNALLFTGSITNDVGDKVNTAEASAQCPSTGCRIRIPPNPAAACWNFSTPIILSKGVVLEGDPYGATCIKFSPNSGTAVTLAWANSIDLFGGVGLRDLVIETTCGTYPCGSGTAVCVQLGNGSNTGWSFFIENVVCGGQGFGFWQGFVLSNTGAFDGRFIHSAAIGNQYGFYDNLGASSVENITIDGGNFSGNNYGFFIHGSGDFKIANISCDDNATDCIDQFGMNGMVTVSGIHAEDSGYSVIGPGVPYLRVGGSLAPSMTVENSVFTDVRPSGTNNNGLIAFGGNLLSIKGGNSFQAGGITTPNAIVPTAGYVESGVGNSLSGITNLIPSTWWTSQAHGVECGTATKPCVVNDVMVLGQHLTATQTGIIGGNCTMASSTSCSFTIITGFSAGRCIATPQGTVAVAGACEFTGTTVTITAASSNSQTWAASVFGDPN